jgi:DNA-binding CsgD family transcriptional regulator
MTRTLEADPEAGRLNDEIGGIARQLIRRLDGRNGPLSPGVDGAVAREIRTARGGSYRVHGTHLGGELIGVPAVLVCLQKLAPDLPSRSALREQFGLTRREAQVAVLLAQRKSNREIAKELSISRHTAHHHTEQVFLKLGVSARTQVRSRLIGY